MKPHIHAQNSVKTWGGKSSDYLAIHKKLDSSKSCIADPRHRALTHNSWFLFILEELFGETITNSDGKEVSVRDIGEQHIVEDLGHVPSATDWLGELELVEWMKSSSNAAKIPTLKKIAKARETEISINSPAQTEIIDEIKKISEETRKQIEDAKEIRNRHRRYNDYSGMRID